MKKLLCFLLPFFLFQCKSDDQPEPETSMTPTILVETESDLTKALCVGDTVPVEITLRTDESIGIQKMVVEKWDNEIFTETNFNETWVTITFDYVIPAEDFGQPPVLLDFILHDNEGRTAQGGIRVEVTTEFSFYKELTDWETLELDLVENDFLDGGAFNPIPDITLTEESEPCGGNCIAYRYTFTSGNGTEIFPIPNGADVSPFNLEIKQEDVLAAIGGVSPLDGMVVYSEFADDQTGGAPLNNFPIAIKIRDTEEFAIMDWDEAGHYMVYQKRSENAGE